MNSIEELSALLSKHRADKRRGRIPDRLKQEILAAYHASGLTLQRFSQILGLSVVTLRKWTLSAPNRMSRPGFHTLKIEESKATVPLRVFGPQGLRIDGLDISSLAALIRALEAGA